MGVALSDPIRDDNKSDLSRTLHLPSTSSFIIILSLFPFPSPSPYIRVGFFIHILISIGRLDTLCPIQIRIPIYEINCFKKL